MTAKIMLFATLRHKYKTRELTVKSDGTLENLIGNASKILGSDFINEVFDVEKGKIRSDMIIMINGRNIKDLKDEVMIKDNDVIAIFPPIAGG
ncbi:MAG: MoaD/ThiS family protein [Candidatus Bathyarchaeia archaeon]